MQSFLQNILISQAHGSLFSYYCFCFSGIFCQICGFSVGKYLWLSMFVICDYINQKTKLANFP